METVLRKSALVDGKTVPGKEFDGFGANRTLGKMESELPTGSNARAEQLLRESFTKQSPSDLVALNTVYLAEVLIKNRKKAEAKKILDDLIMYQSEPAKYNPNRVPETIDEIKDAVTLRKTLGN